MWKIKIILPSPGRDKQKEEQNKKLQFREGEWKSSLSERTGVVKLALQMTQRTVVVILFCSRNTVTNKEQWYLAGGVFHFRWSICF